jgi:hypothetical protein
MSYIQDKKKSGEVRYNTYVTKTLKNIKERSSIKGITTTLF